MRPALLRLLKRPSALSVLESLVSSPSDPEPLTATITKQCLRCQSSRPLPRPLSVPLLVDEPSDHITSHPKLRVHPLQQHKAEAPSNHHNKAKTRHDVSDHWKTLFLHKGRLDYESDIGHTDDIGTRLVHNPVYRNDLSLWLELLLYRRRHYGHSGTLQILRGLNRVGGVQLPVFGDAAELFWQTLVDSGIEQEEILPEVASYAHKLWVDTGSRWPKFYQSTVGKLIELGKADEAAFWHKQLQVPHFSGPEDIVECLNSAFNHYLNNLSQVSGSLARAELLKSKMHAFQRVCEQIYGHHIWNQVVPLLLEWGEHTEAFRLHTFLAMRDDHAQSPADLEPMLRYANDFGPRLRRRRLERYASERFSETSLADIDSKNAEASALQSDPQSSSELNKKHWFEEKHFNDDFGARVFATKALNFDVILSGLKMFAVPAIGPHSLREMAARSHGSEDLRVKLERLDKEGISTGTTVFARLLRRFAAEHRDILLSDLIQSDRHPAMLEDAGIQERLLLTHYRGADWRQYNLTKAVLKELLGDGPELANIHLRRHILAREWVSAYKILDEMLARDFVPSQKSLKIMAKYILTPRELGHGPVGAQNPKAEHELTFVFNFLQRTTHAGADVPTYLWHELIKRFGMTGSWTPLRRCLLWLAQYHLTPSLELSSGHAHTAASVARSKRAARAIFIPELLDAVVLWGFIPKHPANKQSYDQIELDGKLVVPYARGVKLLRELELTGVEVWRGRTRRACRQRLLVLFGPGAPAKKRNRLLRRMNSYSIERIIADLNHAWCSPPILPLLDKELTVKSLHQDHWNEEITEDTPEDTTSNPWVEYIIEDTPEDSTRGH